jgi:hexosaminidase
MRHLIYLGLIVLTLSAIAADHNPILPQPQKVVYGKGQLTLKGLTIGFASKPEAEDIFAARELAGIISKISLAHTPVKESSESGASIIFERTGNSDPLPVPGEKSGPDSRESYRIKVTPNYIRITAKSSAGLFYGVQTLRQMIEGSGDKAIIPEVEIEDWPSLVYRGFMMDMSHSQLPKIEEIKNQIDFLSRWKANQYLFYSEVSIELEGYPLLMADGRFTKEQIKEIIEYAKARHVDVVPNMELYGHLHGLFRLEHYSDLSVLQHGWEFIPDDLRVKPLLDDWITQITKLFPSPFFHIGFDETWFLEYEARKRSKTPEDLYLYMLKQTTDLVEREGKIPLVWVDMLQKYPSIIPKVSRKIIAVPWHYDPLDDNKYEQLLGPFTKYGIPMIVQGAVRNWNWVAPVFEVSFLNTDVLIKAGRKYNAVGFINSGWTDDPLTLMRMGFPDIAYGSVASWQDKPVDRENFFKKYAQTQYPSGLADLVEKAFKSLSEAESLIGKSVGATDPAFWANPFTSRSLKMVESNKENIHNGRMAAEDAQIYIKSALKYKIDTISLTAMLAGARMLDYIGLKYLYAGEIDELWKQLGRKTGSNDQILLTSREINLLFHYKINDIMEIILQTKDIFREAWLNEYTSFRLDITLGKYDQEFQFWLKVQRRLQNMNFREGEALPPLESLIGNE